MPETAFVTDISGEWSDGVTPQTKTEIIGP